MDNEITSNNTAEKLNAREQAFVEQIDRLTEQGVIRWERKGDEMHAILKLKLSLVDSLQVLIVDGGHDDECFIVDEDSVLVEQFVELEQPEQKVAAAAD